MTDKDKPKLPPPDPRGPKPMGDFGVLYQRRMASGGSSFHLKTKEEAEKGRPV